MFLTSCFGVMILNSAEAVSSFNNNLCASIAQWSVRCWSRPTPARSGTQVSLSRRGIALESLHYLWRRRLHDVTDPSWTHSVWTLCL